MGAACFQVEEFNARHAAAPGVKRGIKHPSFIFRPLALAKLQAANPSASLIVALRDPIDWLESNYNFFYKYMNLQRPSFAEHALRFHQPTPQYRVFRTEMHFSRAIRKVPRRREHGLEWGTTGHASPSMLQHSATCSETSNSSGENLQSGNSVLATLGLQVERAGFRVHTLYLSSMDEAAAARMASFVGGTAEVALPKRVRWRAPLQRLLWQPSILGRFSRWSQISILQ